MQCRDSKKVPLIRKQKRKCFRSVCKKAALHRSSRDCLLYTSANFTNGYVGESLIPEVARENGEFFAENSQVAVPLPMTSELSNNIGDINTARTYVIAQVALGYMTVDEGMDYYNKTVGSLSNAVLKSLNK